MHYCLLSIFTLSCPQAPFSQAYLSPRIPLSYSSWVVHRWTAVDFYKLWVQSIINHKIITDHFIYVYTVNNKLFCSLHGPNNYGFYSLLNPLLDRVAKLYLRLFLLLKGFCFQLLSIGVFCAFIGIFKIFLKFSHRPYVTLYFYVTKFWRVFLNGIVGEMDKPIRHVIIIVLFSAESYDFLSEESFQYTSVLHTGDLC
jgi:hypothetical protein